MQIRAFVLLPLLTVAATTATSLPDPWASGFNHSTTLHLSCPSHPLPVSAVTKPPVFTITGLSSETHSTILVFVSILDSYTHFYPYTHSKDLPTLYGLHSGFHPVGGVLSSRTLVPEFPYTAPTKPGRYALLAIQEGPKGTILLDVPGSGEGPVDNFDLDAWRKKNNLPQLFAGALVELKKKAITASAYLPALTETENGNGSFTGTGVPPAGVEIEETGSRASRTAVTVGLVGVGVAGLVVLGL